MTTVSVVTGAAGGMGAECARALGADADVLLLTDVREDRLKTAADLVAGGSAATVHQLVADLGDLEAVSGIAARAAELGQLRALVHTAGLSPNMAGWEQVLRIDLVATAQLLDAFLAHAGPGSVALCVASIAGHLGDGNPAMDAVLDDPDAPDLQDRYAATYREAFEAEPDPGLTYALAKRAVIRLCERAAVPWGARGGRVVSLSPGMIDTEMGRLELGHNPITTWMAETTPMREGRADGETVLPGRIADIADGVAFLCSDAAAFVSGCDLRIDGGLVAAIRQTGF